MAGNRTRRPQMSRPTPYLRLGHRAVRERHTGKWPRVKPVSVEVTSTYLSKLSYSSYFYTHWVKPEPDEIPEPVFL